MGRYDECIVNATKSLEVNSQAWIAYNNRAFCEQFTGNQTAAIKDYQVALAHDPTNAKAWNNLGNTQHDAGLLQEAVTSISKALELDPTYYAANVNRGLTYLDLGKYNEALDDFNHALEYSNIPEAYSGRGTAYYWLGMYDEAIVDLELATQRMPNRPHAFCMLALTYFEVGRFQDSLNAAETVNQIEPGCGGQRLLLTQARSYYALGDYDQAIVYINKAFEIGPFIEGYYYRGIIYQAAGRNEEAINDLSIFLLSARNSDDYKEEIADAKARLAKLKP